MLADAGHDDVITHAAFLRTHAECTMAASIALMHHSFVMMGRAGTTVTVSQDLYEELLAATDRLSVSLKQIARACDAVTQQSLTKAADDYEAMATLMDAGAAMSEDTRTNVHLMLTSLASLDKLAHGMAGDVARLYVPVSTLASSALTGMSTVWRELPDGAVSTVSGRGMKSFVKGAAGETHNMVLVYPRVSSGALAEYVKPDDVSLMLRDDSGSLMVAYVTVERVDDGGLQLSYAITADCVGKLSVSVTVCGVALGHAVTVQSGYDAINGTNHVASYDVGDDTNEGMAVNADGSMIAVSYDEEHQVYVFRLTPSFERVCIISQDGSGSAEFQYPRRLCFTDDDTILVSDQNNDSVQQLTVAGEHLSSFTVWQPFSIAAHGDMVAVDSFGGYIEIHSLATGELIRRFGSRGDGPGQIGWYATGTRFTPGRACLLVAECYNGRLSLFMVDGLFIKHIGAGVLAGGLKDVSFGAGGEIIVTDCENHRICVFLPDGDTLIRTWGSQGTAAGQFQYPKALAVTGSYLYVMAGSRVQVFQ